MTDTIFDTDSAAQNLPAGKSLRPVLDWLAKPQAARASDELLPLLEHFRTLRAPGGNGGQRAEVLDRLCRRSGPVVAQLIAALENVALPVPRKTRETVHRLQELLESLIENLRVTPGDAPENALSGEAQKLAAWRTANALAQHLSISHLAASPTGAGIWRQLHRTYSAAQRLQAAHYSPDGEQDSVQDIYQSALLLGCAQPDSFTAREIGFIAAYLQRFAHCVEPPGKIVPDNAAGFWIDLLRDSPALPCTRKPAPQEASIRYFTCAPLAGLLNRQIDELNSGSTPQQANLPDFAGTPAGRGVLTRLAGYWGNPGKRRFPHRKRNLRAEVCAGLHRIWLLFQLEETAKPEVSTWMITNQSPDGYAIMHVGGRTGTLAVGDITAIRSESENGWQICLVRWALSENPEHLEMGLQILAPNAVPAIVTLPVEHDISERLPVLLLPKIPALRPTETLVTTSGALNNRGPKHVLIVDRENIKVREVRTTCVEEQTSSVEVFAIETDRAA